MRSDTTMHCARIVAGVLLLATLAPAARSHAQAVGQTEKLVALAGNYAPDLPGVYGTDLGFSFKHGPNLWMLFGDSWKGRGENDRWLVDVTTAVFAGDDLLGYIPLGSLSNGAAFEQYVRSLTFTAERSWQPVDGTPPLLRVVPAAGARPITNHQFGAAFPTPPLGPARTPLTGFSNGRADNTAGAFGLFFHNQHLECRAGCGEFACDRTVGLCVAANATARNPFSSACVLGAPVPPGDENCASCMDVGGLCQDQGSSMFDSSPRGRAGSIAMTHQVGFSVGSNNTSRVPALNFDTRPWNTHRFFNAMTRTVNDFDRNRIGGAGNDYETADGVNPASEGVFMWGRPNFGGLSSEGRDAQLYLAWVPMPSYGVDGNFTWAPEFFAGFDQGRPVFVKDETRSVALDLSGGGEPSFEEKEVTGQMTITWLPTLRRWVMIYGGGISSLFGKLIFREDWPTNGQLPTAGPLWIRSAEHPWGPWTAPRPLLDPGSAASASGEYGSGGVLYSPNCTGTACAETEVGWMADPGGLYGPNIVEPWTTEYTDGSVDLYWNMSTWNPYEVVFMKTKLPPGSIP